MPYSIIILPTSYLPFHRPSISTPIPAALTDVLVGIKPYWISPSWSKMFSFILKQPSPKARCTPTAQATAIVQTSGPALVIYPSLPQRPSSFNSPASLESSSLSTKPSNLTCLVSDSSILSSTEMTPSSGTCPSYSMSYAVSSPRKRRISNHDHVFQ